jgi:hypothetical protein
VAEREREQEQEQEGVKEARDRKGALTFVSQNLLAEMQALFI